MGALRLLKNRIAMAHKAILGVRTHGQTSLTVPPFVVNLGFFSRLGGAVLEAETAKQLHIPGRFVVCSQSAIPAFCLIFSTSNS